MFERFTDRARRVAAQVLVMRGAALDRVRQQVIHLLHAHRAEEPGQTPSAERGLGPSPGVRARLEAVEQRLAAIEQRVGAGPDTSDLDEQIETVRAEKEAAIEAQDFERAASLRSREWELLGSKAARREQWVAGHPALPDLAERCQQLAEEIERLGALLRQHGIDPQDKPA